MYVSTWTSMRLAPVRCRVLLHSLLPTDYSQAHNALGFGDRKFSTLNCIIYNCPPV